MQRYNIPPSTSAGTYQELYLSKMLLIQNMTSVMGEVQRGASSNSNDGQAEHETT